MTATLPVVRTLAETRANYGRLTRTTCPTCGRRVGGLLAECGQAGCLTAYLDDDAAFTRSGDR